jgi:erythromycin esterase-like protein
MATLSLEPAIHPLTGGRGDFDALIERIGDARFVLLGESTHGTHQFYRDRRRLTLELVERGFDAVALEADWPDAMRVTRYLRGEPDDLDAAEALAGFERFPTWMWRNADVVELVAELREHDERQSRDVGVYGLDLYSLHRSMEAVIGWVDAHEPKLAPAARELYACFDRFGDDPQRYGQAAALGLVSCEDDVVELLVDLNDRRPAGDEAFFDAVQNATIARRAEAYYRGMFHGRVNTWNLRDTHMADTLDALAAHLEAQHGRPARIVVWAHNSHIGDARATGMGRRGEVNLGQLMRERHGDAAFLVGFSTATGTVTAASEWGAAAERKRLRTPITGSWEAELHAVGRPRWWLDCGDPRLVDSLAVERLERFVGVLYLPETERYSHYVECTLGRQFDALVYHDETRAVEPLERTGRWDRGELPDTYPSSL